MVYNEVAKLSVSIQNAKFPHFMFQEINSFVERL